jgi:hypothetical protein
MCPDAQSLQIPPGLADLEPAPAPRESRGAASAWYSLDQRLEWLGAWSGIAFVIFAGAGYGIARFIPVQSPSLSPERLTAFVVDHHYRILIGMALLLIGGFTFLLTWSLTIAYQVRKYVNPSKLVFYVQLAVGLTGAVIAMFCGVFGTEMAYRANELDAAAVQMLYDLLWFLFLIPWPPFMLWQYALGFAILSHTNDQSFLPRWIGYFSIWAGALELFSLMSPFWYDGPFSYHGLVSFWIPGVSFFVWVLVFAVVQVKNWGHVSNLPSGKFNDGGDVRHGR